MLQRAPNRDLNPVASPAFIKRLAAELQQQPTILPGRTGLPSITIPFAKVHTVAHRGKPYPRYVSDADTLLHVLTSSPSRQLDAFANEWSVSPPERKREIACHALEPRWLAADVAKKACALAKRLMEIEPDFAEAAKRARPRGSRHRSRGTENRTVVWGKSCVEHAESQSLTLSKTWVFIDGLRLASPGGFEPRYRRERA